MKRLFLFAVLSVFVVLGTASPVAAADKIPATGDFTATINSIAFTPVGANCMLEVGGQLNFTGTLIGTAVGTTSALVLAPCDEVGDFENNPPGTFKDVFKSELFFIGTVTVDGIPATAEITYQGITEAGGAIKAHILLKNGLKGNLDVEAIVAVGGSYEGFVRIP